eukprot:2626283-Pyramimonas_sp.AAC.1
MKQSRSVRASSDEGVAISDREQVGEGQTILSFQHVRGVKAIRPHFDRLCAAPRRDWDWLDRGIHARSCPCAQVSCATSAPGARANRACPSVMGSTGDAPAGAARAKKATRTASDLADYKNEVEERFEKTEEWVRRVAARTDAVYGHLEFVVEGGESMEQ